MPHHFRIINVFNNIWKNFQIFSPKAQKYTHIYAHKGTCSSSQSGEMRRASNKCVTCALLLYLISLKGILHRRLPRLHHSSPTGCRCVLGVYFKRLFVIVNVSQIFPRLYWRRRMPSCLYCHNNNPAQFLLPGISTSQLYVASDKGITASFYIPSNEHKGFVYFNTFGWFSFFHFRLHLYTYSWYAFFSIGNVVAVKQSCCICHFHKYLHYL